MMLAAAAVMPPTVLFETDAGVEADADGIGDPGPPAASVPILFPCTTVPVVPAPAIKMPYPLLPEITLPVARHGAADHGVRVGAVGPEAEDRDALVAVAQVQGAGHVRADVVARDDVSRRGRPHRPAPDLDAIDGVGRDDVAVPHIDRRGVHPDAVVVRVAAEDARCRTGSGCPLPRVSRPGSSRGSSRR